MNALAPVMFRFPAGLVPGAQRVAVVGPFNGWNRAAHTMSRRAGGDWTVTIYLPPGRVVYLFDVDGEFWLDPDDEQRMPNSWGSEYSIRHVVSTPAGAEDAEGRRARPGREDMTREEHLCAGPVAPDDHMRTAQGCCEAADEP